MGIEKDGGCAGICFGSLYEDQINSGCESTGVVEKGLSGVAGGMAIALTDKMAPAYAKSGVETQRTPWAFPERGGNTAIFMNQQYDEYYKLLELTKSAGTKTEVPAPEPEPKPKKR